MRLEQSLIHKPILIDLNTFLEKKFINFSSFSSQVETFLTPKFHILVGKLVLDLKFFKSMEKSSWKIDAESLLIILTILIFFSLANNLQCFVWILIQGILLDIYMKDGWLEEGFKSDQI